METTKEFAMHVFGMGIAEVFIVLFWYGVILLVLGGIAYFVIKSAVRAAIKEAKRDGDL